MIEAIQKAHLLLEEATANEAQRSEAVALIEQLSGREKEVLSLISRGFSTREIADTLALSPRTVESHRARISEKLGTKSAAEMTRLLIDSGIHP